MAAERIRAELAKFHYALWRHKVPLWRGRAQVAFYRFLYPNFSIGRDFSIWGRFDLTMFEPLAGRVTVGDHFYMVSEQRRSTITLFSPSRWTVFPGAEIVVGDHVGVNGLIVTCRKRISIGDHTMTAANVILIDTDGHVPWPPEKRFSGSTAEYDQPIEIGRYAWIGANSIILKGSKIGDNSIIGAGSVVSGEIPANCLAAGNPARVIRRLGPDQDPES